MSCRWGDVTFGRVRELVLYVCLRGQFPHFSVSRQKTTTTKILTYFSANGDVPYASGCVGAENQLWTIKGDDTISTYDGAKCLETQNGGGPLQVWECTPGKPFQKWRRYGQTNINWMDHPLCLQTTGTPRITDSKGTTDGVEVKFDFCNSCVEASNVCLITDSGNPGPRPRNARSRLSFLCCERLTLGVLLEWTITGDP